MDPNSRKQFIGLVKLEFKKALRTRSNIFTFFILPFLVWLIIFGFTYMERNQVGYQGENFYLMNLDSGNNTVNLGEEFVSRLRLEVDNNDSALYKTIMKIVDYDFTDLEDLKSYARRNAFTPFVLIHENFTNSYINYEAEEVIPVVEFLLLPKDGGFGNALENAVSQVLQSPPFTIVNYEKAVFVNLSTIAVEQNVELEDTSMAYMIVFMSSYLTIFAPAFYVAHMFTDEREMHTLESMLSLPISKQQYILGKITSGSILGVIFSAISSVSMYIYSVIVSSEWGQLKGFTPMDIDLQKIIMVFLVSAITMMVSISLGTCLIIGITDKKAAEQAFIMVIVVPSAIVPIMMDIFMLGKDINIFYIIPWVHTTLILQKSLFPVTYKSYMQLSSFFLDMVLHLGSLLLIVFLALILATWRFNKREEYS